MSVFYSRARAARYAANCSAFIISGALTCVAANAQETLTVVSFGGQYSLSQIEAYQKPYTAKSNVKINAADYKGGLAEIRAQVHSKNVDWDVVDIESQDLELACREGLLERIDSKILNPGADGSAASADFQPGTVHECGVGTAVWSNIIAYNADKFPGEKPKTIADFFDLKKFPGRRAVGARPNATLEWALIADGVPYEKVYDVLSTPEGVDRAFKKLDTIKSSLMFWEAGAQPPQLLADGQVVMTTAYSGRIQAAVSKDKKPLHIIWENQIWNLESYAIPLGSRKKQRALDFIAFATDTQRLADQAKYIPYAPARKSSMALIPKEIIPDLPTDPAKFQTAIKMNARWWAEHLDEMNERFAAWRARSN